MSTDLNLIESPVRKVGRITEQTHQTNKTLSPKQHIQLDTDVSMNRRESSTEHRTGSIEQTGTEVELKSHEKKSKGQEKSTGKSNR